MVIDYFFSTMSPFSYLAGDRLERIAAEHGASVRYRPFDIMAVFSQTGGVPPKDRHPSRQAYRLQDLGRTAKLNGMPLNLKPTHWPTNPAPSSYAVICAQEAGGGDVGALARFYLEACWSGEKDIAEDAVVREGLAACGFPESLADSGLLKGAESYEANTADAVGRNVFGAPTYIAGEQVFWGQDRLGHLGAHLKGEL